MRSILIAFITSLVPLVAHAEATLNLFTWSEYIDPEVIKDFEVLHRCKVTVDLYEDNESLLAKMDTGGASLYDVIVPSDYVVRILSAKNLLAPLRKENIPNIKNIDDTFLNPPFDKENTYSVPYQWGTFGIFIRKKPGETIDETWGLLLDGAKQPGPFVLIDSVRDAMSMALKYTGKSINTTDPEAIKEAAKLLKEAKSRSLGFDGAVGGKNRVVSRAIRLAAAFNGDAVRAMKDDPETFYFVPREGSEIWVDNLAIPVNAPHRDLAEHFLNFILDAKVGARISDFNQYATPNKASLELVNPEDRKNPAIYPPPEVRARLEFIQDLGTATQLYDEVWTEIKG